MKGWEELDGLAGAVVAVLGGWAAMVKGGDEVDGLAVAVVVVGVVVVVGGLLRLAALPLPRPDPFPKRPAYGEVRGEFRISGGGGGVPLEEAAVEMPAAAPGPLLPAAAAAALTRSVLRGGPPEGTSGTGPIPSGLVKAPVAERPIKEGGCGIAGPIE